LKEIFLNKALQFSHLVRTPQGTATFEVKAHTTIRESLSTQSTFQFIKPTFSIENMAAQISAKKGLACLMLWENPPRNWALLSLKTTPIAPQEGWSKAKPSMLAFTQPRGGNDQGTSKGAVVDLARNAIWKS